MSDRKPGWYWVRFYGRWLCIEWKRPSGAVGGWVFGDRMDPQPWDDGSFEEIGPRVSAPDEPWQTVPVEATPLMAEIIEQHMDNHGDGAIAWRAALLAAPKP